jgi:alkanesulfonate monooxygenase SsuD/methylene tetrahydromethanopterin reductase-like flavin-dependent oxidoreductase (luciferase family)
LSEALGVAFCWHQLPFEELCALVQHAERLGYAAAYVDGDVSMLPSLGERDVLDGWTLQAALIARTERIAIASIRLVHHWNAAKLAQAIATQERVAPGRQRVFLSVGGHAIDRRFGLAMPPARERVAWLEETIVALRRLWRGEEVTCAGRYVTLDRARVRPVLAKPPALEIGAKSPALLGVVARHADTWNVNLPAVPARVAAADATLAAACAAAGRDPHALRRALWIFARPEREADDATVLSDFRRFNPWFHGVPDAEAAGAVICGGFEASRRRLAALRAELRLDLPVVELTGLPYDAARRALEGLAPAGTV